MRWCGFHRNRISGFYNSKSSSYCYGSYLFRVLLLMDDPFLVTHQKLQLHFNEPVVINKYFTIHIKFLLRCLLHTLSCIYSHFNTWEVNLLTFSPNPIIFMAAASHHSVLITIIPLFLATYLHSNHCTFK